MAFNLKLPGIEPARPVPGAAEAIDRAGTAFQGATREVANVLLEMDKAEVVVQTQEATLQTTKGLADVLHLQKSTRYVGQDEVRTLFGGEVPADVRLDEEVAGPGGKIMKQPRKAIPMHEVAPALFERQAATVIENAARNVKDSGWQERFRTAAAADVERARGEMLDWSRGQKLADFQIRTVSQLQQAAASRNWSLYEVILDTPDNHLNVDVREKLRAELPHLRTEATIQDRLRGSETAEEIDALLVDIAANDKFLAPLSAEQQYQFTVTARARKDAIISDAQAARKAARDAKLQALTDGAFEAIQLSTRSGRPATAFFDIAAMDAKGLDLGDLLQIKNAVEADPNRVTNWEVYNRFARMTPEELRQQNVIFSRPDLADTEFKEVEGWWRAAKGGEAKGKAITDYEDDLIGSYVAGFLKLDPKEKQHSYNVAKARIANELLKWKRAHPEEPLLYTTIGTLAAPLFTGDKKAKGGDAQVLTEMFGALGKSVTNEALGEARKAIETEAPLVEEAFERYVGDGEPDDELRALVHADLTIPENLERIQAQLRANGLDANNKRLQVQRSVQNRAPEQSADYAARAEEEEMDARRRAEANTDAEKKNAEEKAARAAASKAERERRAKLPDWERQAEALEADALEASDGKVHRRVYEAARARGRSPDESLRETKREVARTQEERHTAIRLQSQQDREAYREFLRNADAGDSVAKYLRSKHGVTGFEKYVQLRREGKVF